MFARELMPLVEVKNRLSELLDDVERTQARVVITRHGRPSAVLISIDDLESLEETLAIMSDPQLMADIREGRKAIEAGDVEELTKAELLERLGKR